MSLAESTGINHFTVGAADAAEPPKLGFLRALYQSVDLQDQVTSTYHDEASLQTEEARNADLSQEAGVEIKPLGSTGAYGSGAIWNTDPYWRAYNGMSAGGGRTEPITAENDKLFEEAKRRRPDLGIKNYAEMRQTVAANQQAVQAQYQNSRWTPMGYVGGALGSIVESFNPHYNSLLSIGANLLPIGGAVKMLGATGLRAALARTVANGVVGAGVNAIGNIDGGQQESIASGMQPESLPQAALSGFLGGVALSGVSEGAAALGRRLGGDGWFEHAPNDLEPPSPPQRLETPPEAPPPDPLTEPPPIYGPVPAGKDTARRAAHEAQPYGASLDATSRVDQDLSAVSSQLDQWDGPRAGETDMLAADPTVATPEARAEASRTGASLDEIARRVDPPAVGEFQRLGQQMDAIRQQIDHMNGLDFATFNDAEIEGQRAALRQLDEQVAQLETQRQNASRKNAQRLSDQADELYAQRRNLEDLASRATSTEAMARRADAVAELRSRLIDMDERRRDLAPLVTRAYDTARQQVSSREAPEPLAPHERPEEVIRAAQEHVDAQAETATTVTDEAIGRMRDPEPTTPPEPQEPGTPPPLDRDEIQLPSGRTVRLDDVAEAIRDENEAGGVMATKTVRQMLAELEEDKALDAASRFCAL